MSISIKKPRDHFLLQIRVVVGVFTPIIPYSSLTGAAEADPRLHEPSLGGAEDGEECPGEGRVVKAGPATNAHLNQPTL
jgi:hypothetical protein